MKKLVSLLLSGTLAAGCGTEKLVREGVYRDAQGNSLPVKVYERSGVFESPQKIFSVGEERFYLNGLTQKAELVKIESEGKVYSIPAHNEEDPFEIGAFVLPHVFLPIGAVAHYLGGRYNNSINYSGEKGALFWEKKLEQIRKQVD